MKGKQFQLRLQDDVRELLEQAAKREGLSLSEFIKKSAINAANSVMTPNHASRQSVITPKVEKKPSVITPQSDSGFERFKRFKPTSSTLQDYKQLRPWIQGF